MKTLYLSILCFLYAIALKAQGLDSIGKLDSIVMETHKAALDSIIIETYYISDANDATDQDGGNLPQGSITYRVYADMKPGYILQAVFALEGHELLIGNPGGFFNNADRGATFGDEIRTTSLDENTLALDSWLTIGAASDQHQGVLKSDDWDGSIVGGTNNDGGSEGIEGGLLVNNDPLAGIPITQADGMVPGTSLALQNIGADFDVPFGSENFTGSFLTSTGIYNVNGGVIGPTNENRVLIGQFTVIGGDTLKLKLNLQLKLTDSVQRFCCHDTSLQFYDRKCPKNGIRYFHTTELPSIQSESAYFFSLPELLILSFAPSRLSSVQRNKFVNNGLCKVFPNPAKDIIMIDLTKEPLASCSYVIYDILGKPIISNEFKNSEWDAVIPVNIARLKGGIYSVKVALDDEFTVVRFIKN
ncbi:MAG: T9SS type A sorting domain-containing protein [Bacteroidales bacterium]|nr:T9SS type A sorting domain-containing protein [Bacteroidales bacterium]